MNFFVSHKNIGNSFVKTYLHNNLIIGQFAYSFSIYTLEWVLVNEKHFYEKITDFCICSDTLIILFGDKIVQCDFDFNCLVQRELKYSYKCIFCSENMVFIHNNFSVAYFGLKDNFVSYSEVVCSKTCGLPGFTNTIIAQNGLNLNKINLDGDSTVLGSIPLLDFCDSFYALKDCIFVVYRHAVEIHYKNDKILLSFSNFLYKNAEGKVKILEEQTNKERKLLELKLIGEHSKGKDIEHFHADFTKIEHVFQDSHVFEFDNSMFLLNGNGDLYKITIKLEANRISMANIDFVTKISKKPISVTSSKGNLLIGSSEFNSFLFKKVEDKPENTENYVKLTESCFLEANKLENLGKVHSLTTKPYKTNYNAKSSVFSVENTSKLNFKMIQRCNSKMLRKFDQDVYYLGEDYIWYDINNVKDPKKYEELKDDEFFYDQSGKFLCKYENSEFLFLYNDEILFKKSFDDMMLSNSDKIQQVLIKNIGFKVFLFVVANNLLHAYSFVFYSGENTFGFTKIFLNEFVWFKTERNALEQKESSLNKEFFIYKGKDFIYTKSTRPFFILLENSLVFVKSKFKFDSLCQIEDSVFVLCNNELGKIKIENNLKNQNLFVSKIKLCNNLCKIKKEKEKKNTDKLNIKTNDVKVYIEQGVEEDVEQIDLKQSIYFNIGIKTKNVPFRHIPFIPVVHRTTDDNKAVTERIEPHKDNFKTALLGVTKRFSMVLYDQDLNVFDSIFFNEDEYVADFKIICEKYVVVSVVSVKSEEICTSSKLMLFAVQTVVAEKNEIQSKKLKFLCEEHVKFAITTIDVFYKQIKKDSYTLNDVLVVAGVNTRLMAYEVSAGEFGAVGRLEAGLSIQKLLVIRNMIIFGDLFNGMHLYFLRPENPLKLTFIANTMPIKEITNISAIIEEENLFFISTNKEGKIYMYTFAPVLEVTNKNTHLTKLLEINTQLSCYAVTSYLKRNNKIIMKNNQFEIKMIKVNENFSSLYNKICDSLTNTLGLNPDNFLMGDELKMEQEKDAVYKQVLLEYQFMNKKQQDLIRKDVNQDSESVLGMIDNICNENY